jgi:large subunit ribosomal protein L13
MKTVSMRAEDVQHSWMLVDAQDKTLGRLATEVARRLRGKHKPQYTPHVDTGDFIVVINAEKIRVTGAKERDKIYYRHTGYPGGIKGTSLGRMRETHPERIIEAAVKGMLPRNPLGRAMFKKLKIYSGDKHPHAAQQPVPLEI